MTLREMDQRDAPPWLATARCTCGGPRGSKMKILKTLLSIHPANEQIYTRTPTECYRMYLIVIAMSQYLVPLGGTIRWQDGRLGLGRQPRAWAPPFFAMQHRRPFRRHEFAALRRNA